jgi:hypothetical protein
MRIRYSPISYLGPALIGIGLLFLPFALVPLFGFRFSIVAVQGLLYGGLILLAEVLSRRLSPGRHRLPYFLMLGALVLAWGAYVAASEFQLRRLQGRFATFNAAEAAKPLPLSEYHTLQIPETNQTGDDCGEFCRRALFNGSFRTVIVPVRVAAAGQERLDHYTAFSLGKGAACENPHPSSPWELLGICILRTEIARADYAPSEGTAQVAFASTHHADPLLSYDQADIILVLPKHDTAYAYRYGTAVTAYPLPVAAFFIGPIAGRPGAFHAFFLHRDRELAPRRGSICTIAAALHSAWSLSNSEVFAGRHAELASLVAAAPPSIDRRTAVAITRLLRDSARSRPEQSDLARQAEAALRARYGSLTPSEEAFIAGSRADDPCSTYR